MTQILIEKDTLQTVLHNISGSVFERTNRMLYRLTIPDIFRWSLWLLRVREWEVMKRLERFTQWAKPPKKVC